MQDQNELNALIKLLDDPDINIYRDIENRILSFGITAREYLKEASLEAANQTRRLRLEKLISLLNFEFIKNELKSWKNSKEKDLLTGMNLIAEYQYPDLNTNEIRHKIEAIRKDAWLELNNNLTALEQVKILNHVFFDIHGFKANKQDFYAPENSYINDLLLFKKGNPISLSALYSIIAQSLDIPIYGVNLPEHFILAYVDSPVYDLAETDDILFYINVFNNGVVFTKNEINQFLRKVKLTPENSYFLPCSNNVILQRMLNNLIFSYSKTNKHQKVKDLEILIKVLQI